MKQQLSVHAEYNQAEQAIEIVIRCSPGMVSIAMEAAQMQIAEVAPGGAVAPAIAPAIDEWVPAPTQAPPVPIWNRPQPIPNGRVTLPMEGKFYG
jgi:hypothetical protein